MKWIPDWFWKLLGKKVASDLHLEDKMDDTKKWYQSKGVWAGLVTILTGILAFADQYFGTHITTSPYYATAITFLGAMGLYSRVTADTKIG